MQHATIRRRTDTLCLAFECPAVCIRRDAAAKAAFPGRYDRAAFIALHGSWNRAPKNGYK